MNDTDIQWHPGFVAAMELELIEYSGKLYFQSEHNLSKEPLQIDLLGTVNKLNEQVTQNVFPNAKKKT